MMPAAYPWTTLDRRVKGLLLITQGAKESHGDANLTARLSNVHFRDPLEMFVRGYERMRNGKRMGMARS